MKDGMAQMGLDEMVGEARVDAAESSTEYGWMTTWMMSSHDRDPIATVIDQPNHLQCRRRYLQTVLQSSGSSRRS